MFWSSRNLGVPNRINRWCWWSSSAMMAAARMNALAVISVALALVLMPLMCAATAADTEVSGREAAQGQDFEVRYLSGEPDYKSVNLTWEVEPLDSSEHNNEDSHTGPAGQQQQRRGRSFNVFYCELQNWGPHRCRSKTLTDDSEDSGNSKQYTMTVKNLRMATKYSFHVKPQVRRGDQKASGRSEQGMLEDEFDGNAINQGQTIVIPTKGFSAHATQCLPHASEIEVQTGPFFGGRIGSENGQCGIQGDASSDQESYIMRIDHEKCGSRVNPSDLTVETSITVQENLGILTHSTRRFVVVCTFQPDTLTVRARLALPSKGKGGASVVPQSEWWPTGGRNARERQFKMVDKSSLVLKGSDEEEVEDVLPAKVEEVTEEGEGVEGNLSESSGKQELSSKENEVAERKVNWRRVDKSEPLRDAKYARLFESKAGAGGPVTTGEGGVGVSELENDEDNDGEGFSSRASDGDRSLDLPGLLISACLAVIMIGAFVYVLQKEFKKQRIIQQIHQHQQMQRPPAANRMPAF